MKVKVIESFIDKETRAVHKVGTAFECTEKRFAEIQKVGNFVVKAPDEETGKETKTAKK